MNKKHNKYKNIPIFGNVSGHSQDIPGNILGTLWEYYFGNMSFYRRNKHILAFFGYFLGHSQEKYGTFPRKNVGI